MNDAGRSGAGNYEGKVFKYFQEMHFSTYKTLKNSTTTNAPKKPPSLKPSLSSTLLSLSCNTNLPAILSNSPSSSSS